MIESTCVIGEHCMAIVDRLRMFFELYLFPARLTNFKRAVVHVYTQANISGKGRAKPRMRGVGAPPLGDAAHSARVGLADFETCTTFKNRTHVAQLFLPFLLCRRPLLTCGAAASFASAATRQPPSKSSPLALANNGLER